MSDHTIPYDSFAKHKTAMVSPFRARPVINMIRGKGVAEAHRILILDKTKSAKLVLKVLQSAVANAEQKGTVDLDRLFVSAVYVDEGPRISRWFPRAQGRADPRVKRTSHITVQLAEKKAVKVAKKGEGVNSEKKAAKKAKKAAKKTKKTGAKE